MSSVVGTRRGHAAGTVASGKPAGRLLSVSAARPSRIVPRQTSTLVQPSASLRPSALGQPSTPVRPSPSVEPHGLPAEIQRNRILSAAIRSTDEVGYAHASVAQITSRARVSRRTFYELFPDRDACLLAAFEQIVAAIERDLASAELGSLPWRERVRLGLWTILSFLEREPAMANVCVVQSLQGDAKLLARREALLLRLAEILDEGRTLKGTPHDGPPMAGGRQASERRARTVQATALTAEALVGAALSVVHTRLLRAKREPLTALLGELMGLLVLPYLGPAIARREQTRPVPAPLPGQGERSSRGGRPVGDPFDGIEMRLTYRTLRVLECVAANPGASNRQVGVQAGVPDQGQISKLLSRLERLGLLENTGKQRPKGEANAWELTARGLQVTQTIRAHAGNDGAIA